VGQPGRVVWPSDAEYEALRRTVSGGWQVTEQVE
jgi:hypothetical protein